MSNKYRRLLIVICTAIPLLAVAGHAAASSAVSQGFKTSGPNLVAGSLVVLKNNDAGYVQAATSNLASQLVGVIADQPLVELGDNTDQAQVVVSGQTEALVSDINGPIYVGDKITASPISGTGMKALTSTEIVGTAESNLSSVQTYTYTVHSKAGKAKVIHVGAIPIEVNVSYYTFSQSSLNAFVPTFLLDAGAAIAGKDVSPMRVLIAFMCLFVGFVIAGVVLQAAVRSGIISIGRNPLAQVALRRSLVDVLVTTIGLLGLSVIVFYVTLTL